MDKQYGAQNFAHCIAPAVAVWLLLLDRKSLVETYLSNHVPVSSHVELLSWTFRQVRSAFLKPKPSVKVLGRIEWYHKFFQSQNKTFQFSNRVLVSTFARSHDSRTESSLDVYSSKNSRGWASITSCQKTVVNLDDRLSVQVSSGWSFFAFCFGTNFTPATVWYVCQVVKFSFLLCRFQWRSQCLRLTRQWHQTSPVLLPQWSSPVAQAQRWCIRSNYGLHQVLLHIGQFSDLLLSTSCSKSFHNSWVCPVISQKHSNAMNQVGPQLVLRQWSQA